MLTSRALLVLVLAAPIARADVLVVDAAGGGDFTTLSAAVAAAADGDTILVRAGEYAEAAPVVIDGKGLAIVGELPPPESFPPVTVFGGLVVQDLQPAQRVLLQNLIVGGANSTGTAEAGPALVLQHDAGHVRTQFCFIVGGFGASDAKPDGALAVHALGDGSTAFLRGFIGGGLGQDGFVGFVAGDSAPGLVQSGGQVHLADCQVNGGDGPGAEVGGWPNGGDGGTAVVHSGGVLLVAGGSLNGGQGGWAHHGGDGGHALALGGSGFAWLMAGVELYEGEGGVSDDGPDGADGLPLSDPSGLATHFGGEPRGFAITSPLREGQAGVLDLGGAPAETTFVFASLGIGQIAMPGHQGVFVLSPSPLIGPFVIGPPGDQDLPFVAPSLPAAMDAVHLHLQPAYVGASVARLGPGAMLTIFDASFSF